MKLHPALRFLFEEEETVDRVLLPTITLTVFGYVFVIISTNNATCATQLPQTLCMAA